MATKKTSSKKTAAKADAKTPDVPAVVSDIRNVVNDLRIVVGIPTDMKVAQGKLADRINMFATRVEKTLAGAGKKADKEAARVKRAGAKTKRDADKRVKKVAARDALKAKLAKMEKDLES